MRHIGDVVLIYYEEQPAVFARIEAIEPDVKKGWYQVLLLILTLPVQPVTWILREEYIDGTPFTMGGKAVRLEEVRRVAFQQDGYADEKEPGRGRKDQEGGRVIPFRKPQGKKPVPG